ncbi:MAG: DUF47 family protein [Flavipsychrobacter sp.]|nr:DUF47 family protein [Flavipsychrobacter sp.]
MMSIRKLFSPSGTKFYVFFEEVAQNLVAMSDLFIATLYESDPGKRQVHLQQLVALDKANDLVTHRLFNELGRKFITPFDREDIHSLISTLKSIAAHLLGITKQLKSYHIDNIPQATKNVAGNLQLMIKQLAEAISKLQDKRHLEQLYPFCQEIKKMADRCTSLTDAAIARVYSDEQNPYEVIKKLDHYEMVHNMLNRCYNATSVIESVIIKYA